MGKFTTHVGAYAFVVCKPGIGMETPRLNDLLPKELQGDLYSPTIEDAPAGVFFVVGNKPGNGDWVSRIDGVGFTTIVGDDVDCCERAFEIKHKKSLDALRANAASVTIFFGVITFVR